MNVFDLVAKITLDDNEYKSKLGEASSFTSKIGGAITGAVGTVAKAGAVAIGAGATAVTAITKQAVDAYAEYEQLRGGIKKLFADTDLSLEEYAQSVGKNINDVVDEWGKMREGYYNVMAFADEAYKTAGMSANEYMETVTSFSASLIKSLNGDTVKSSEYADRAIRDMADNANTFGTSLESIQNAYQGFAKENYTMLDNLKLGYGGTKEGMQALIEDASKLTDVQKKLNITVEDGDLSFGNIVNAISVMQESMKIAGTTANEAMGTISGSLGMLRASWDNILAGLNNDSDQLPYYIKNLVESAGAVIENIMPVAEDALEGIGMLIDEVAPVIIERLPALVEQILPILIETTKTLVGSLAKALPEIFQSIRNILPEVFQTIFDELGLNIDTDGLFELFDNVISGIVTLFENLGTTLAPIIEGAVDLFNKVVSVLNAIMENQDALDLIESIAIAIGIVVGAIKAWTVIQGVINFLLTANPIGLLIVAIGALIAVIVMLIKHWDEVVDACERVWEAMKEAFGHLGEWFKGIWEDIKRAFAGVGDWFKSKFNEAKEGVKTAWSNITGFFTEKWDSIKNIFSNAKEKFKDIGRNIVEGIKNGILGAWDTFTRWITDKFTGVVNGVKKTLGIHSPSTVFQNIGEMCVAGLEKGSDGLFDGTDFDISASVKAENKNNNQFSFDYEQLGQSVANALAGFSINMDGRSVAQLIAGDMNYQLGVLNARRV